MIIVFFGVIYFICLPPYSSKFQLFAIPRTLNLRDSTVFYFSKAINEGTDRMLADLHLCC